VTAPRVLDTRAVHTSHDEGGPMPHGEMLRLLRSHGFIVEDLIEIQAPRDARRDFPYVSADWAHNWPSEEVWKARLAEPD
jgi:hypothetical protein